MVIWNEHRKKYLNRRLPEIDELKKSIVGDKLDVIFNIGHKLKGNGATFGYPEISDIGRLLEEAANLKDKVQLEQVVQKLEEIVVENLKSMTE